MTTTRQRDIRIVVRPLADAIPVNIRLRRALKYLLRSCNLRCVAIAEVVEPGCTDTATDLPVVSGRPEGLAGPK